MKIAGVVVFYHPNLDVVNHIDSYIEKIEKLYVYDNSESSYKHLIENYGSKVEYLGCQKNMGIAYALNMGAKRAIEEGYQWLLTMDQDSHYEKEELQKLIDYIACEDTNSIGLVSPWHKIKTGAQKPIEEVEDVVEVMTSGNLVSLEAYQKVGGWKDWMFIDSVDIEFCMNLHVHGYRVIRLNYVELEHELGDIKLKHVLGRTLVCSNHNYLRRYYIVRNIHYVYDMYHNDFPEYCAFIKNGLKGAFRNVLVFEKDKYRKIRNMYRGYRDFKKGIKGKYDYKN